MWDDIDIDFDVPWGKLIKAGKEIAPVVKGLSDDANEEKTRRSIEKKLQEASSDAERRIYQKMLDKM